jgi:hypothetical protein
MGQLVCPAPAMHVSCYNDGHTMVNLVKQGEGHGYENKRSYNGFLVKS